MCVGADALASNVGATTDSIIGTADAITDDQWMKTCPVDGRQVNVVVDHVSTTVDAIMPIVGLILGGQPLPPLTMEIVEHGNQEHMKTASDIGKKECLDKYRKASATAAAKIRGLSDGDLDKRADWSFMDSGSISPVELIEMIIIGHSQDHLNFLKTMTAN